MSIKRIIVIIGVVFVLSLGFYYATRSRPVDVKVATDATYMIDDAPVTLSGGVSDNDGTITRSFGNEAIGDVNGDGKNDVAFLVTQSGGGSGTFYYLVVALATDGGYRGTNAILLGDRIAPQGTQIQSSGQIIANYADRLPTEPMTTQPSVGLSKYIVFDGTKLIEGKK